MSLCDAFDLYPCNKRRMARARLEDYDNFGGCRTRKGREGPPQLEVRHGYMNYESLAAATPSLLATHVI